MAGVGMTAVPHEERVLIDYKDREAWLAGRKDGVGASEVAALFGISPRHSTFSLWAEKTGRIPPLEISGEWLEWGLLLEEPMAKRYETVTGRRLWQGGGPYCVAQHPTIPFLRCTPDRWVTEAPGHAGVGILQLKNTNAYKADDWDGGPPDFVQVQVQAEMAVTGAEWGSVAVLVGGNEFRYFDLERNPDFISELEAQVTWFWGLVQAGTPPPVDGSSHTEEALKRLHPLDDGSEVELETDAATWARDWDAAKDEIKNAEKRKTEAENQLRAAIGAATYGRLPGGMRLSLKHTTRKGYTSNVPASTYRTLRIEKGTK